MCMKNICAPTRVISQRQKRDECGCEKISSRNAANILCYCEHLAADCPHVGSAVGQPSVNLAVWSDNPIPFTVNSLQEL